MKVDPVEMYSWSHKDLVELHETFKSQKYKCSFSTRSVSFGQSNRIYKELIGWDSTKEKVGVKLTAISDNLRATLLPKKAVIKLTTEANELTDKDKTLYDLVEEQYNHLHPLRTVVVLGTAIAWSMLFSAAVYASYYYGWHLPP